MEEFTFDISPAFNNFINEDKSRYRTATEAGYHDPDNDFLVGDSGGFLMNMSFKFTNVEALSFSAITYWNNKRVYIDAEVDSPAYTKFRRREEYRREHGFVSSCKLMSDGSIRELRITGEHYNFLNYVKILRLDYDSIIEGTGKKKLLFPRFFDSQYWYYKCKEFSERNGFHMIINKTRRGGLSYMEGKGSANYINLHPDHTVLLAAFDKKYVTKGNAIAPMALDQLEFYEDESPFGRGIITRDIENIQLGYRDKKGTKKGYLSRLLSVSTGPANPAAAIGKDAQKIKAEELGNFPNFDAFMTQTEPTTRTGSFLTGHIIAFGIVNSDNEHTKFFSEMAHVKKKVLLKLSHNKRFQSLESDALNIKWDAIATSTSWLKEACEKVTDGWEYETQQAKRIGWYHYSHEIFNTTADRRRFGDKDLGVTIGTLIHAHPLKGSKDALDVMNALMQKYPGKLQMVGVGEVPEFSKNKPPWLNYVLNASRSEMAQVMKQVDIWIIASYTEGLGRMT
ncbi:hypothetical protein LCGC14_1767490, partial [marine sediment metagenome]